MALNFKKYQREDRKSLGTIAQIVGVGGSYRLASLANFLSEKRVVLVLTIANGDSDTVVCSPAVSAGLRDKSISLSQVQHLEVCEYVSASGEITNTVTMPSAGVTLPTVVVGEHKAEVPTPVRKFNPNELVAF